MQDSGIRNHLEGGDENTPFRNFISRLVLAKFSRPQLRNVQLALEDKATGFVVNIYNKLGKQRYAMPNTMTGNEKNSLSVEAYGRVMTMTEMKGVIDSLLGDEFENICTVPPEGEEEPEGLSYDLVDDICEYCDVPKEHRPE